MSFAFALDHPYASVPYRATLGAAGFDLTACEDAVIPSGEQRCVDTGVMVQMPEDCYGRIAPRSGLAAKHGMDVLAGVVDCDWRGTLKVILRNHGTEPFSCKPGDRIAQLIFERIYVPETIHLLSPKELTATERNQDGFGSTGV